MGPVLKNTAGTNQVKMKIKVEVQPLINSAEFLGGASCLGSGQVLGVWGWYLKSLSLRLFFPVEHGTLHPVSPVSMLPVVRAVLAPSVFDSSASKKAKRFGRATLRTEFTLSLISSIGVGPDLIKGFLH